MMVSRENAGVARKIFLIATEESGDRLGAGLMNVLRQRLGDAVRFEGIGGRAMAQEGLQSRFPIEQLSIIGLAAVVKQLPMLLRRIRETADAVIEASPDILVIIDSPDFTHRVAKQVRARDPSIPIVNYVSPTVWAWRPGRAHAFLGPMFLEQLGKLFGHDAAELLGVDDGDRAAVVARDVVADADGDQFDRRARLDILDHPA